MSRLLVRSSLRYLSRHLWQAGLAVLGVALGVAVVVSIELANGSAQRAFELSTEAVTGRATHSIEADGGLPETVLSDLILAHPTLPAAPVLDGYLTLDAEPGRALPLLGVDPFAERPFRPYLSALGNGGGATATARGAQAPAELDLGAFLTRPNAVLLAGATAARLGVGPGDTLAATVGERPARLWIAGLLQPADEASQRALADLVIADISTAQELLGMAGRLSRIDLIVPEGAAGERLSEQIARQIPPQAALRATAARQSAVVEMTRGFRLNLRAMALLALVCGAFLIYNTMTFSVVQRRAWIGRLRALGVSRREIFTLVLGEAAAIGTLGTALGLLMGVALGRGLVKLVVRTVNDFYFRAATTELAVDPGILVRGALLGLGAALLAALAPAFEATAASPSAVLRRSQLEENRRRRVPLWTALALLLLLASAGLMTLPTRSLSVAFGGLAIGILGAALLAPAATVLLARLAAPVMAVPFGLLGRMAARGVTASLSRTGVAIATLMITVAVTIGVGVMVSSFRATVVSWLGTTLLADVYISPAGRLTSEQAAMFTDADVAALLADPLVEHVNTIRWRTVETDRGPTMLRALVPDIHTRDAFKLVAGDSQAGWQAFESGDALWASEPLAYLRDLSVGDVITLQTPRGPRALPLAGIFADFASDQGALVLARDRYRQLWDDDHYSGLAVFAAADAADEALVERARQLAGGGGRQLLIHSTRGLRDESLAIFDRTFLITNVLRILAGTVAFIGVLSALMALQLERARELGVLRATGLTPGQLWQLVGAQTGLMGLVAGLLAIPVGLAMAAVMIYVINRRSFGWSLSMDFTPAVLLQALALALAAALLAGVYPAYRMASTSPAVALREE